ncbi:Aldehyde oxidase and xanthine dehydrogenase, a/b hammerhead domain [Dethiosulfatibacter aminovorans DSM 17477]|uniref:Aldehyde oxidase and xanthine dehydrogenase, a/b hammerhead domain n=1 Tax=Dethiosulfatibacter aminovorans DSM 17477 TaxID=1121476 RepID=A0A1M6A6F7_9FIRM|nr:molybdopterin cofactor-binding domain-containing protein [Dethiosulfatibacter aminovorans]SHI32061.1 Aldehyde oxidase and xanthine dehydrogenase, a/b hammerhead domain [Dethiosulfatibacter aminovorans DSM 17477]
MSVEKKESTEMKNNVAEHLDEKFNVVGKSVRRKDALDKVLGKTKYVGDLNLPGMLYGGVKRSELASAKVVSINTDKAKTLPGVAAVLTYEDIPGKNLIGIINKDEPILVEDKVRRYGDALAVVAAESEEILEKALGLIEVELEEIEGVFTIEDALREDSPKVHGETNILSQKTMKRGDVEEAFKKCDVIVENSYYTPSINHVFIETEATIAKFEEGILTFWSSTQNPHYDRGEVAVMLGLPLNRVRSIQGNTGGGFGGKLDISTQCHAALLAYYTEKPVKMIRKRQESMQVSSKRHPHYMTFKTGATKDGKILAMEAELKQDTGAYGSYGLAVITRAMVHAQGPYEVPNIKITSTMVYTNNPMCGAMRGFGVPQVAVAHETQIDMLAEQLGIDPIDMRFKNCFKVGARTGTGQLLTNSVGIRDTIIAAREKAREEIDTIDAEEAAS